MQGGWPFPDVEGREAGDPNSPIRCGGNSFSFLKKYQQYDSLSIPPSWIHTA